MLNPENEKSDSSLLLQRYASPSALELTILPTEQCPFRCFGCYEEFKLGKMEPELVEGVKNLIKARSEDLKQLYISWFGGEPLLAYDVVLDTMRYVKEICPSKGINFSSGMTTNGYLLTADKLKELTELNVKFYQVAFDGDKEHHDKTRVRADGKGTFDQIWSNMVAAHETNLPFEITLRIHVSKENAVGVEGFLEKIAQELHKDDRFKVFIRPISRLGGPNDSKLPVLEGEGHLFANYGNGVIQKLRSKALELGIITDTEKAETVCYASKLNSFVIRSNGELSKCTVAFSDERNHIGRLLRDGTVEIDSEKVKWWARGLFSGDENQLACPLNAENRHTQNPTGEAQNNHYKVALKN
jgi:uncharacterized protein